MSCNLESTHGSDLARLRLKPTSLDSGLAPLGIFSSRTGVFPCFKRRGEIVGFQ